MSWFSACISLWLMLLLATPASARQITLILSDDAPAYLEVERQLRAHLKANSNGQTTLSVTTAQWLESHKQDFPSTDLWIAAGLRASETVTSLSSNSPAFLTLIPKAALDRIANERRSDGRQLSGLYLDQPIERQLNLIRLAFPNRKRVGALLGPDSAMQLPALLSAAREYGLQLNVEKIFVENELLSALQRVLLNADVLLALPDATVFNRNTVQGILLTTYRFHDPLAAYAEAYVNAGATVALYTTPAQVADQTAEAIVALLKAKTLVLPPPQYPKYFSIKTNPQVARSLGVQLPDEDKLLEMLKNPPPAS